MDELAVREGREKRSYTSIPFFFFYIYPQVKGISP
jgi:hypothetical protein